MIRLYTLYSCYNMLMDDDTQTETEAQPTTITQQPDYSDTRRYKRLANGAIYDMVSKRICANPGGGTHAITSQSAYDLHNARYQRAQEAVQQAIIKGTKVAPGDVFGGLQTLAEAQVKIAMDKRQGRASTEAYKTLVAHAGLVADKRDSGDGIDVHIERDTAMQLLAMIAAERERRDNENK